MLSPNVYLIVPTLFIKKSPLLSLIQDATLLYARFPYELESFFSVLSRIPWSVYSDAVPHCFSYRGFVVRFGACQS